MVADESGRLDRILVRVGANLDDAEAERVCGLMRMSAVVTLDFGVVRHFDHDALHSLAREISANSSRVVLRGLSARHYMTLRKGAVAAS